MVMRVVVVVGRRAKTITLRVYEETWRWWVLYFASAHVSFS